MDQATSSPPDQSNWEHRDGLSPLCVCSIKVATFSVLVTPSLSYEMDQATPSPPDQSNWEDRNGLLHVCVCVQYK